MIEKFTNQVPERNIIQPIHPVIGLFHPVDIDELKEENRVLCETTEVLVFEETTQKPELNTSAVAVDSLGLGFITATAFEAGRSVGDKRHIAVHDKETGLALYSLTDRKGFLDSKVADVSAWEYLVTADPEGGYPIIGARNTNVELNRGVYKQTETLSELQLYPNKEEIPGEQLEPAVDITRTEGLLVDNPRTQQLVQEVVSKVAEVPNLSYLQKRRVR